MNLNSCNFPIRKFLNYPQKRFRGDQLTPEMRDYTQPQLFEIAWEVANKGIFIWFITT